MDAPQKKVCFVVSPIGQSGSDIRQKADDFLEFIVRGCEAIDRYGYEVIRGDHINEPGRITTQVVRLIDKSDLVIADVTGGNANVYYELALRDALGKPLITCAEQNTALPFDTRDQRTIFYSMHSRLAQQARIELGKQIDTVNSGKFVPENPIVEALKVIKLAESTDSSEQTLGRMLQLLDDLAGRISSLEHRLVSVSARNPYALPPSRGLPDVYYHDTSSPEGGGGIVVYGTPGTGGIVASTVAAPFTPSTSEHTVSSKPRK